MADTPTFYYRVKVSSPDQHILGIDRTFVIRAETSDKAREYINDYLSKLQIYDVSLI